MRKSSYDIQLKSPWSKKPAPNQAATLAQAKMLSSSAILPAEDLAALLAGASSGSAPMSVAAASAAAGPQSQSVVRGMALAALAVLGKAGDADTAYIMPLLVNDGDGFCFNMSKLNLYQCLSVARPYYEDVYCLGLHAMADTGRCVKGALEPPDVDTKLSPSLIAASTTGGAAPAVSSVSNSGPLSVAPLAQ